MGQDAASDCRDVSSGDGRPDAEHLPDIGHSVAVFAAYLDGRKDAFLLPAPKGGLHDTEYIADHLSRGVGLGVGVGNLFLEFGAGHFHELAVGGDEVRERNRDLEVGELFGKRNEVLV